MVILSQLTPAVLCVLSAPNNASWQITQPINMLRHLTVTCISKSMLYSIFDSLLLKLGFTLCRACARISFHFVIYFVLLTYKRQFTQYLILQYFQTVAYSLNTLTSSMDVWLTTWLCHSFICLFNSFRALFNDAYSVSRPYSIGWQNGRRSVKVDSKGFWRLCTVLRITGFLDSIHRPVF
jgi:hypothetical protein